MFTSEDTTILHPIYLYPITDHNHKPFVPKFEWTDEAGKRFSHDICSKRQINQKLIKEIFNNKLYYPEFWF